MLFTLLSVGLLSSPLLPDFTLSSAWTGRMQIDYTATTCAVPLSAEDHGISTVRFSNGRLLYHGAYASLETYGAGFVFLKITGKSYNAGNTVRRETMFGASERGDALLDVFDMQSITLLDAEGHERFTCTCTYAGTFSRKP